MREEDIFREQKIYFRWLRLYRVLKIIAEKEIYILKKLNDAELDETIADNQLKKFYVKSKQSDFAVSCLWYSNVSDWANTEDQF